MGGTGSGRRGQSDEEKKQKGTFRAEFSEESRAQRAAEKIVTGPWLSKIPEPDMPLNEVGRAKYDEITKLLFEQNTLTQVTCMDCQVLALHWQNVRAAVEAGKKVSSDSLKEIGKITARLRIAENAPPIKNPNEKGKFQGSGFSNKRSSPVRLRRSS